MAKRTAQLLSKFAATIVIVTLIFGNLTMAGQAGVVFADEGTQAPVETVLTEAPVAPTPIVENLDFPILVDVPKAPEQTIEVVEEVAKEDVATTTSVATEDIATTTTVVDATSTATTTEIIPIVVIPVDATTTEIIPIVVIPEDATTTATSSIDVDNATSTATTTLDTDNATTTLATTTNATTTDADNIGTTTEALGGGSGDTDDIATPTDLVIATSTIETLMASDTDATSTVAGIDLELKPFPANQLGKSIVAGNKVAFWTAIRNNGDATTSNFVATWLLDGEAVQTKTAWATVTPASGWLAPAAVQGRTYFASTTIAIGHHTMTLVIDPANKIAEANENNNSQSVEFDVVAATSTATSTDQVWRVNYYRYEEPRPDMAGDGIPFNEIEGTDYGSPLSGDFTADWFDQSYFQRTELQAGLEFGDRFIPFTHAADPITDPETYLVGDNFGARFMGLATVTDEGDYTYTYTSDGDVWFYVDGQLNTRIRSGIKPAETKTGTIHMVPGQTYVLQLFFTERIAVFPYFNFTFPGVHISPCEDDQCSPIDLGPDVTPPTVPVIIDSDHTPNITSADASVYGKWSTSTDPVIPGAVTSGLAGYSFEWSQSSTTIPDMAVDQAVDTSLIRSLSDGTWWFHINALDNAGNQSATSHFGPIIISNGGVIITDWGIVNARVSDTSLTTATLNWRTENSDASGHAANSRVVYDTVSHPDIASSTDANYGYAFSTSLTDTDPKTVEHAVTVSGLSKDTKYYFRVISQDTSTTDGEKISGELNATTDHEGGGGGGGGGGGNSGGCVPGYPCSIRPTTTPPTVLGTTTQACPLYLKKYIKLGADNDPAEVKKLQAFLKYVEGETAVPVSGVYDQTTYDAVRRFQSKRSDILDAWGIEEPTGYVFITTSLKINYLVCQNYNRITLDLRGFYPGMTDEEALSAVAGTSTDRALAPVKAEVQKSRNFMQATMVGLLGFLSDYLWLWLPLLIILLIVAFWDRMSKEDDLQTQPTVVPTGTIVDNANKELMSEPNLDAVIAPIEEKQEDDQAKPASGGKTTKKS